MSARLLTLSSEERINVAIGYVLPQHQAVYPDEACEAAWTQSDTSDGMLNSGCYMTRCERCNKLKHKQTL